MTERHFPLNETLLVVERLSCTFLYHQMHMKTRAFQDWPKLYHLYKTSGLSSVFILNNTFAQRGIYHTRKGKFDFNKTGENDVMKCFSNFAQKCYYAGKQSLFLFRFGYTCSKGIESPQEKTKTCKCKKKALNICDACNCKKTSQILH